MSAPSVPGRRPSGRITVARALIGALLFWGLAVAVPAVAADTRPAEENQTRSTDPEAELPSAPVVIDGQVLFRVRGTSAFPPERRAARITSRFEALAADRAVPAEAVRAVQGEAGDAIVADGHRVMVILDADARRESLERKVLSEIVARAIRTAVTDYRQARSREVLLGSAVRGVVATALLTALVLLVIRLSRRAQNAFETTYRQRVQSVGIQSF